MCGLTLGARWTHITKIEHLGHCCAASATSRHPLSRNSHSAKTEVWRLSGKCSPPQPLPKCRTFVKSLSSLLNQLGIFACAGVDQEICTIYADKQTNPRVHERLGTSRGVIPDFIMSCNISEILAHSLEDAWFRHKDLAKSTAAGRFDFADLPI